MKKKKKREEEKMREKWDYIDEKIDDWDVERKMSDWDASLEIDAGFLRRSIWLTDEGRGYTISFGDGGLGDEFDHLVGGGQMIWSRPGGYTYWRQ